METPGKNPPELRRFECPQCGLVWSSLDPASTCSSCFQVALRERIPDQLLLEIKGLIRNDLKLAAIQLVKQEMSLNLMQAVEYVTQLMDEDAAPAQ